MILIKIFDLRQNKSLVKQFVFNFLNYLSCEILRIMILNF